MTTSDTQAAVEAAEGGQSPERLTALSDGIYSIAMTLLVLDVAVPDGLDPEHFREALASTWPNLAAYALSFGILAGMWRDQRRIFDRIRSTDRLTLRLTLASLGAVALLPFPTALLSEYGLQEPIAVAAYAAVAAAIHLLHLALVVHIRRHPQLQARPMTECEVRLAATDHAATVLIAVASITMAYAVSPHAGILTWLLAVPIGLAVHLAHRKRRPART